jgi:hypothetical protein
MKAQSWKIEFLIISLLLLAACFARGEQTGMLDSPLVFAKFRTKQLSPQRVELSVRNLHGNHPVGIVCSNEVWGYLLEHSQNFKATIISPKETKTIQLTFGKLGFKGTYCDQINGCHYLFTISGYGDVTISLFLPSALNEKQLKPFDIVVMKSPEQTEL